jgi:glycosyltransferase involved in cell wall biosynthesis
LLNESLAGGGAERQFSYLANQLVEDGYRVFVATWGSPEIPDRYSLAGEITRLHLRVHELQGGRIARTLQLARSWVHLLALIRRLNPGAVISFSDASNILSVPAARLGRCPVVVSIRENPEAVFKLKPHWKRLAIRAYHHADVVVAQTEAVAQWCRQRGAGNPVVVPNMLRGKWSPSPPMSKRQRLVVSVGSLNARKGHDVLLRAFATARSRHADWRLAIVGEGPQRRNLESLCDELGIRDAVTLAGFEQNIPETLANSSIFALASRSEGLPNALIEAMAMGNAAIAADCDYGPRDIITHGVDGLLVPVDDVGALAAALSEAMADESLRSRLGTAAQRTRKRFATGAVMPKWRRALDEAIQPAGAEIIPSTEACGQKQPAPVS